MNTVTSVNYSKTNNKILIALTIQNNPLIDCSFCKNNDHFVYKCNTFFNLFTVDRLTLFKLIAIVYIHFLRTSQTLNKCNTKHTCSKCKNKRNTLFHFKDSFDLFSNSKTNSEFASVPDKIDQDRSSFNVSTLMNNKPAL